MRDDDTLVLRQLTSSITEVMGRGMTLEHGTEPQ